MHLGQAAKLAEHAQSFVADTIMVAPHRHASHACTLAAAALTARQPAVHIHAAYSPAVMARALRDELALRHCPGARPRQNSRLDTTATVLPFMELTSATPKAPSALKARPCQHGLPKPERRKLAHLHCVQRYAAQQASGRDRRCDWRLPRTRRWWWWACAHGQ